MKLKNILIAIGATLGIGGAYLYYQYRQLMGYKIKVKRIKVNKISLQDIDLNIYIAFKNKSSLEFTIVGEDITVFINGKQMAKVVNKAENLIKPNSVSMIGVNIVANYKSGLDILGKSAADFLVNREKVAVKFDMNIDIRAYGMAFKLPFVYETNLKELMTPSPKEDGGDNEDF